jgi:hypothetical protein
MSRRCNVAHGFDRRVADNATDLGGAKSAAISGVSGVRSVPSKQVGGTFGDEEDVETAKQALQLQDQQTANVARDCHPASMFLTDVVEAQVGGNVRSSGEAAQQPHQLLYNCDKFTHSLSSSDGAGSYNVLLC